MEEGREGERQAPRYFGLERPLFSPPLPGEKASPSHPSQTRELTDRIREQNGQDPGRVTHTRQEVAGPVTF